MGIAITQVDSFTDTPFAGNPAAVCLLDEARPEKWMQLVAREMNLSETAFLVRNADGFDLRWLTPTTEVDLCGHATLASAHFLWEEKHLPPDQTARFHTRSGLLQAEKIGAWIEMDFPSMPVKPIARFDALESALGAAAKFTGQSRFDCLVELPSDDEVRALKPDFAALRRLPVRGVIATSVSSHPEYDFVSRFFAPAAGIDEDPVTGSAHCCLAPYWKERLGRDNLTGYQASARGGYVRTRCEGNRVRLSGQAVTVLRAELL
ncbi:MAG: PhzF family phenazine biosynthesis protein [Candidatus Acidiferrales bacterium]